MKKNSSRAALLSTVFISGLSISANALTLTGTEGDDTIIGTNNPDTIFARGGSDTVDAKAGDDWISTGTGDADITGGSGSDLIIVGQLGGNDLVYWLQPGDTNSDIVRIDAGDGDDSVAMNQFLPIGSDVNGGSGIDSINIGNECNCGPVHYENVRGFENWVLDNAEGLPLIIDNPASSTSSKKYIGLSGNRSNVTITNENLVDLETLLTVYDTTFGQTIDASAATIAGVHFKMSAGVDTQTLVFGTQNADLYDGSVLSDYFQGNAGEDVVNGGDGIDTSIYTGNRSDYTISEVTYNTFTVKDNRPNSPDGTDTIIDVNKLQFADQTIDVVIRGMVIIGDDSNEEITGGTQSDFIDGAGGNDGIAGGPGNDTEVGGTGSDTMMGGLGNDFVFGDTKPDEAATSKVSAVAASADVDTINYTRAKAAITVNLKSGKANSTASGDLAKIGVDTLKGIENIKSGPYDDTLRGSSANNFIDGGNGRDVVIMSGKKRQYTVTYNSKNKTYVVVDKTAGRDGTDTLKNVEVIRFTDGDQVTMSASSPASSN